MAEPLPSDRPAQGLPAETTPTWEMELLVSGATVFGLLQLPHALDGLFYDLFNRSADGVASFLLPLWMYAKIALLTLVGTFVLHLALRGYWVALVGLDSVYPGGIRWERLRMTPHHGAVVRSLPDVRARIELADNRATRVFGVGFGLALVMLLPFAIALILALVSTGGQALGMPRFARGAVLGITLLVVAPFFAAHSLDRRFGQRIDAGGALGRTLRTLFRAQASVGMGRGANPLLAIFQSNEGPWRTGLVIVVVMAVAAGGSLVQFFSDTGELDLSAVVGLPDDRPESPDTVLPAHYATTRGTEQRTPAPPSYIQDRVVRGPYVELFVPYRPRQHAAALRSACPDAVRAADAGGPPRPALDCWARLLEVKLDGAPVTVPLEAASDPLTGLRGALFMIPAEALRSGQHELTLRRSANKLERIPFWR